MLDHPDIYTEDQYALLQKSLQPVYGLTEGLTQNFFMKTMHSILDSGLLLPDPLPADIRRQYQLPTLSEEIAKDKTVTAGA